VTSEDVPQSEEIVGGGPDSDPYVGLYEGVPIPNIDSGNKFGVNSFVSGAKKVEKLGVESEAGVRSGKFERGSVEELGIVAAETSEHQDVGRRVQCHHVGVRR